MNIEYSEKKCTAYPFVKYGTLNYNDNNSYFNVLKKCDGYDLLHLLKYNVNDKIDCVVKRYE